MAGRAQKTAVLSQFGYISPHPRLVALSIFVLPAGLPGCHVLSFVSSHAEAVA